MTEKVITSAGREGRPSHVFVSSLTSQQGWANFRNIVTGGPASATYAVANSAFYFPIRMWRSETVYRFFWVNGTTASTNNIQVGLYDRNGVAIKLGTQTLAAGVSAAQFDNIADFVLPAGEYQIAIWCNGTTTHLVRFGPSLYHPRAAGLHQQTGLTGGLPTTATYGTIAQGYTPIFGLALRASP